MTDRQDVLEALYRWGSCHTARLHRTVGHGDVDGLYADVPDDADQGKLWKEFQLLDLEYRGMSASEVATRRGGEQMTDSKPIPTERLEIALSPKHSYDYTFGVFGGVTISTHEMARRLLVLEPEVVRLRGNEVGMGAMVTELAADLAKLRERLDPKRMEMLEAAFDYANDADSDSIDLAYAGACEQSDALLGAFQKSRAAYRAAQAPADPVDALRDAIITALSGPVPGVRDAVNEDTDAILDVIRAHPAAVEALRKGGG